MCHNTRFVSVLLLAASTGLVSAEETPEGMVRKSIQATGGEDSPSRGACRAS